MVYTTLVTGFNWSLKKLVILAIFGVVCSPKANYFIDQRKLQRNLVDPYYLIVLLLDNSCSKIELQICGQIVCG